MCHNWWMLPILSLLALAIVTSHLISKPALATLPLSGDEAAWKQITRPHLASDSKLFDLFPLKRAQKFGKDIVVDVNGFKVVDVDNRRLVPLLIPGASSIYSVCDDTSGRLYALCQADKDVLLKVKDGDMWSNVELPVRITERPQDWVLAADDGDVVIGLNSTCYVWHEKRWIEIAIKKSCFYASEAHRNIMKAGKLFCTFNEGEWGGKLTQVDTTTGAEKGIDRGNITEERIAQDGKLWWVVGGDHLGLLSAALLSYNGVKTKRYCEVSGMRPFFPTVIGRAKPRTETKLFHATNGR